MRAERTWPEPLIQRLQLVAQIFTNALARKQTETALRESEARLSLTTEAVGAGLWIMDSRHEKGLGFAKEPGAVSFCPG